MSIVPIVIFTLDVTFLKMQNNKRRNRIPHHPLHSENALHGKIVFFKSKSMLVENQTKCFSGFCQIGSSTFLI